jgi:tetratricopeptide (TPR) repeat protein
VPEHRQPPPQKPFALSIQASFRQDAATPQFVTYGSMPAPQQGDAASWFKRANALREERQFGAALTAFDQAIALKPDYAEAHNGRGIVLAGLQRFEEAVAVFDRAIALKPDYTEAYNNRGLVLHDVGRLDAALESFDRAIALRSGDARMHKNRGALLEDLKRFDDAVGSYDRAIALNPDDADAYNNRSLALQNLRRFDEALAGFDRAIALRPDYAEAYSNRGIALQELNRLDEASADFAKAIALRPDFAEAAGNQGYCLLKMGRFEQGWPLHEWRKQVAQPVGNRALARPLWLGQEDISHATVFIHWEQGLGDTIQFCRYGKLLRQRGAKVVMSVQEALHPLVKGIDPAIEVIKGSETPDAFDYHCPLLSLPLAFGTTLRTIPCERRYIVSDAALRRAWDARLPPRKGKRIGLVWKGNPTQKNDRNRSIALGSLAPLFGVQAQWISLQKEPSAGDLACLAAAPQIVCLGTELHDFSDTAAVIDCLDLVIAVDTSVAHLAGAMGKPVWIPLAFNADWRWLTNRDDSPWYPTARLFRQTKIGSWDEVLGRILDALSGFAASAS